MYVLAGVVSLKKRFKLSWYPEITSNKAPYIRECMMLIERIVFHFLNQQNSVIKVHSHYDTRWILRHREVRQDIC